MARSGSYSFTLNRTNLITRAYQYANIYDKHTTVRNDDMEFAADLLNMIVKAWQTEGLQLWNRKQATLFPVYQTKQYSLSNTGDNCTNSYVSTTLSADEAVAQTSLSVTSSTGMTAADRVGIQLDDGTRQWTTIVSVDSSTQITVTTALTGAAASGNTIVTYTNKIGTRPLRIVNCRKVDLANNNTTTAMMPLSYDEYWNYPSKDTDGDPNNYHYDKQLDAGILYLYPRPSNVNAVVEFTYHEPVEDVNTAIQNMDFPTEWLYCLLLTLVVELAYANGKMVEVDKYEPRAEKAKLLMQWFDSDEESLRIKIG